MRFAVFGAGAVGCYFGAMLARAGYEVVLIGRARHVFAISQRGLRFQTPESDELVSMKATTDVSAVACADVVFVCTKSTGTLEAATHLREVLPSHSIVVSLQNGIENAPLLRERLKQPVIAAAVYVAAEMAGDGHLLHHGRGDLVIDDSPEARRLAAVLHEAAIPVQISPDVNVALWRKLTLNCAYNAISAILMQALEAMPLRDILRRTMSDIVEECFAVAATEGVTFKENVSEFVGEIERTIPPGQLSSTAQDLGRGKASEIDYLNGTVVRLATERGIPVPANRTLYTLVKMLEANAAH
ncbi:ketopantoate reductase family protein [Paraburkholderia caledonica]|uniref:2-dehydropantoate 2-reductase n=1 Tax=Paraburkholderia caledonica TaxID=134536 RepID=A0AB73INW4_9BURK|nr:2-dehydropantoate 2-reductase [Paraburkholderia caledonica]